MATNHVTRRHPLQRWRGALRGELLGGGGLGQGLWELARRSQHASTASRGAPLSGLGGCGQVGRALPLKVPLPIPFVRGRGRAASSGPRRHCHCPRRLLAVQFRRPRQGHATAGRCGRAPVWPGPPGVPRCPPAPPAGCAGCAGGGSLLHLRVPPRRPAAVTLYVNCAGAVRHAGAPRTPSSTPSSIPSRRPVDRTLGPSGCASAVVLRVESKHTDTHGHAHTHTRHARDEPSPPDRAQRRPDGPTE